MNSYIEFRERDNRDLVITRKLLKEKLNNGFREDFVFNNKAYDVVACVESNIYIPKANIELYVNGTPIQCQKQIEMKDGRYYISFRDEQNYGLKLFSLVFDVASIVVEITGVEKEEYISEDIICLSNIKTDARNIEHIVNSVLNEEDELINKALFVHSKSDRSAYGEEASQNSSRSIDSLIRYASDVVNVYKQNYSNFKSKSKHSVTTKNKVTKANKVSVISQENIHWLMSNLDVLYEVPNSGISIGGDNYIPYEMSSVQYERNYAIYENQVVLGLLLKLTKQIGQLIDLLQQTKEQESEVLNKLEKINKEYYVYTVVNIKRKYVETVLRRQNSLKELFYQLGSLYKKYSQLFNCQRILFDSIPKRTKVFSELAHYKRVYNLIVNYEKYASVEFDREKVVSSVKTIDKLYEYYCLIKLIKMLTNSGYKFADEDNMSKNYTYSPRTLRYDPETNVANTYYLENEEYSTTLYYEPVIYNYQTTATNGIELYRTTDQRENYYCPDFLLSFINKTTGKTMYFILDAKYSNRYNLRKYNTLFNSIKKYHLELATTNEDSKLNMIWLLQGKTDKDLWDIDYYHNSQMSRIFKPSPVCGIFNLNFDNPNEIQLYDEIKKYL